MADAERQKRIAESGSVRISGALISVVLHAGIVILLVKVLVFRAPEKERSIDIQVVQERVIELDPAEAPDESETAETEVLEAPESLLDELPPDDLLEGSMIDSDMELRGLDSVAEIESPLVMKGLMVGRSDAGRKKLLRTYGGRYGSRAEQAVLKGLDWLKENQRKDGAWGVGKSRSITARQERARLTGLALLCYLAHGETAQSQTYGETVRRAMQYLLDQQDDTGSFVPFSKTVGSHDDIGVYGHAISTYALCEAYAMTRLPMLKLPLERAVQLIIEGQQKKGGWDHRYQHEKWSDLSVGGWQIQALRAAQAAAVPNPDITEALEKSVPFVQGMHAGGGRFYYRLGNKTPNGDLDYMTGVAVLCMQLAGSNQVAEVDAGLDYLRDVECSDWNEGWEKTVGNKSFNIAYEWYYNTQAIFQKGGSKWQSWNNKFAPMLIDAQDASGAWKPPSEEDQALTKDIIYTTGFCCLSLQVYYRILPSFNKGAVQEQPFEFDNDVQIVIY